MAPPPSPNFYSQQNGSTSAGSNIQSRAQFRRQGSSYGSGHVHNLAVVQIAPRVDYSFSTKGGPRSWAVLVVFILLCSTILTIFSEKEPNEDVQPTPMEVLEEENAENDIPATETQIGVEIENQVDEEDDDNAEDTEVILLAKLKEKAVQNEAVRRKREKSKRLKPAKEEEENVVKKENIEAALSEEENVNEEDDGTVEEEDDEDLREVPTSVSPPKEKEEIKREDEVENDDEDDDEDEDEDDKYERRRHAKREHLKRKPWGESIQAQKVAEDHRVPRKGLLKQKKTIKLNPTIPAKPIDDEEKTRDVEEQREEDEDHAVISIKKKSGGYGRKAITSREDFRFREELDAADFLMEKHDFASAQTIYDRIISRYPESSRAHYGKGRILQLKSEFGAVAVSTDFIEEAIDEYEKVLNNDDTPDELFRLSAEELVDCAKYTGNLHKAITVQRALIDRFPAEAAFQNEFGKIFLTMGRPEDARKVFMNVLDNDPLNSMAQVYYGYILKVYDEDMEKGIQWMRKGLKDGEEETHEAKFYFHLGDALTRAGKNQEAYKVFEDGVRLGLFPSIYQRSVHNLGPGCSAVVEFGPNFLRQTPTGMCICDNNVERQWTIIREESAEAWHQHHKRFVDESFPLNSGSQKVLYIRKESEFLKSSCRLMPNTCEIAQRLIEESSCVKDEIKISVLLPGERIWPHCGPTNYELEAQLGLQTSSECRIRVGHETKGWKAGKFLVFDPSFETELWFDGATHNTIRIAFHVELWHPGVPRGFRTQIDDD